MNSKSSNVPNLVPLVWSTLFTALIAAGALLSFPLGSIPFVLSNFFVFLAGLILGPFWGGVSVALYLVLGGLGLPVFANASGGLTVLFGQTSGFLFGFFAAVIVIGLIRDPQGKSLLRNALALILGILVVYLFGIPVFSFLTNAPLAAVTAGMLPFFVGDLIKGTLALLIGRALFVGLPVLRGSTKKKVP